MSFPLFLLFPSGLQVFDVAACTDKAYYPSTVLMTRNERDILWSPLNYTPVLELTVSVRN